MEDNTKKPEEATTAKIPEPEENQPTTDQTPLLNPELSTKEAYFASLNSWVKHANIAQNAMALFPWYLLSSYPQIFQNQAGMLPLAGISQMTFQPPPTSTTSNNSGPRQVPMPAAAPNGNGAAIAPPAVGGGVGAVLGFGGFRILDDQTQAGIINRTGGYEYVIAPFWKRAVAEIIDVFILLILKIVVTFTVMNVFNLDLGFDLDKEVIRKALDEEDYTGFLAFSLDFLAFSSDLLLLELLTKTIVCFYEAIWTTLYNGATPGKALMNLRIQFVEAVLLLPPPAAAGAAVAPPAPFAQLIGGFQMQPGVQMRALLFPAETPNFTRSFVRSVAKNLIMTLLFPMCFIMIFFKNNRTAYDIMTKTIVVEGNANPVLRRQQQQQQH